MMFQGSYQTAFYRELHGLLHRDLELRHRLARAGAATVAAADAAAVAAAAAAELTAVEARFAELRRDEAEYRSLNPTAIDKDCRPLAAPDLSQPWN
jgi:hypothetical protein